MKRVILNITLVLFLVLIVVYACFAVNSATEESLSDLSETDIQNIQDFVSSVSDELEASGSSILEELMKQKQEYQLRAEDSVTVEERQQWLNLANSVGVMIDDYENYTEIQESVGK